MPQKTIIGCVVNKRHSKIQLLAKKPITRSQNNINEQHAKEFKQSIIDFFTKEIIEFMKKECK